MKAEYVEADYGLVVGSAAHFRQETRELEEAWSSVHIVQVDDDYTIWYVPGSPWADAVAAGYCGA
jgi:hypothetical protein